MTIDEIQDKLRIGGNSPHDLAEMRAFLSSAYSYHAGLLQEILKKKAISWLNIRTGTKSDASADRTWDSTPDGLEEMENEMMLKRIDKLMSGIGSLLRVAEGEARNQY